MARLFYYLMQRDKASTMEFVRHISQANRPIEKTTPTADWALIRSVYNALRASNQQHGEAALPELDAILSGMVDSSDPDLKLAERLKKAKAYTSLLGITGTSVSHGRAFVNGKHFDLDDHFLQLMQIELREEVEYIQGQFITGALSDASAGDPSTYFYDMPLASKRRNRHIYLSSKAAELHIVSLFDSVLKLGFPGGLGSFLYPVEPQRVLFTTYLVADFDDEASLRLVKDALTAASPAFSPRIAFIHNPAPGFIEPTSSQRVLSLNSL